MPRRGRSCRRSARRKPHVDRLQHHSHHRNGEKGFKKSVAVPVEHPDRLARAHADFCEGARQPPDPITQFGVGQALQVAVDDLLARRLGERRVEELLDQQRIRIGRRCYGDYSLVHRRPSHLVVRRQRGRLAHARLQAFRRQGSFWPRGGANWPSARPLMRSLSSPGEIH